MCASASPGADPLRRSPKALTLLQILHLLYQTQRENHALYFEYEKSWGTPQHRGTEGNRVGEDCQNCQNRRNCQKLKIKRSLLQAAELKCLRLVCFSVLRLNRDRE